MYTDSNEIRVQLLEQIVEPDDVACIKDAILGLVEHLDLVAPIIVTGVAWNEAAIIGRCFEVEAELGFEFITSACPEGPFSFPAHFLFLDADGKAFNGELYEKPSDATLPCSAASEKSS